MDRTNACSVHSCGLRRIRHSTSNFARLQLSCHADCDPLLRFPLESLYSFSFAQAANLGEGRETPEHIKKNIYRNRDSLPPSRSTTGDTIISDIHPAGRCITHQAVFSTEPFYPYTILSFNDIASLLFSLTHSHIRLLPLIELFRLDVRDALVSKIKENPSQVVLCGDIVPVVSYSGVHSHASLWLNRSDEWLVWVIEHVDLKLIRAQLHPQNPLLIQSATGDVAAVTTRQSIDNMAIRSIIPSWSGVEGPYTLSTSFGGVPVTTELPSPRSLTITLLPYLSGIILVDATDLTILSLNPVFAKLLLGFHPRPHFTRITTIIPTFLQLLNHIIEAHPSCFCKNKLVSEYIFSEAANATSSSKKIFARHFDTGEIPVDIQMKLVEKSTQSVCSSESLNPTVLENLVRSNGNNRVSNCYSDAPENSNPNTKQIGSDGKFCPVDHDSTLFNPRDYYYALWVTFSRDISPDPLPPVDSIPETQISQRVKTSIEDFEILENMGEGAYGRVKKVCNKKTGKIAVMKYVTKSRILVDTWHRDRTLGTVPLEIHILDYLSRHPHPHIMQLLDYFEDSSYYYLETLPVGPGLDLFDYIELNNHITQSESRKLFRQVALAVGHLHNHGIVHRDIKDENVVLDFSNNAILIDFGSASWCPSSAAATAFDTFHGTLDYAAPEVLKGMKYSGKEQDVWALGILAYTIVFRENPFYNIDEIMEANLRVPFELEFDGIGLISWMLERDVTKRPTMKEVLSHPWCQN